MICIEKESSALKICKGFRTSLEVINILNIMTDGCDNFEIFEIYMKAEMVYFEIYTIEKNIHFYERIHPFRFSLKLLLVPKM